MLDVLDSLDYNELLKAGIALGSFGTGFGDRL